MGSNPNQKTALARRYACQVTKDISLAGGWVPIMGINGFTPNTTPNIEDASDYDTDGWSRGEVTMQSWTSDIDMFVREQNGAIDPGQQIILDTLGQFGDDSRIGFRYFDRNGLPDAHQGVVIPTWKLSNTGVKNLGQGTATMTGDGPLYSIENPYQATTAPKVSAVSPSGAAEGEPIAITGSAFTGATAVTVGGTEVEKFDVINDGLLVATVPTGAAGPANVIVTTQAGASAQFAYTRA
jgi:hypothetical protein